MSYPNEITRYVVRTPGGGLLSEHRSEKAAHRAAKKANRICCPGHRVYAKHRDGAVTGPYPPC